MEDWGVAYIKRKRDGWGQCCDDWPGAVDGREDLKSEATGCRKVDGTASLELF